MTIIKRDGRAVEFKAAKIETAIFKAIREACPEQTEKESRAKAKEIATKLAEELEKRFDIVGDTPTVESVQDAVEMALFGEQMFQPLRAFIVYREQHKALRDLQIKEDVKLIDDYVGKHTWEVRENANATFSLPGLNNHIAQSVTKRYWLHKLYTRDIRDAHLSGAIHIHDLGMLAPYCVGWSLYDLLVKGFHGVPGKAHSKPAKHLDTALMQILNFTFTLQGEAAGAQAWSSVDTYLAPFIRADKLSFRDVKQSLQVWVHNMVVETRASGQCPFSNITLDIKPSTGLAARQVIIGGQPQDTVYGDYQAEIDVFNKALLEVMLEGDGEGKMFTFPIPTVNITADFDWNSEVAELLFKLAAKYGAPYFSNFINSDMNPNDIRSMCPMTGDTLVKTLDEDGCEGPDVAIKDLYDMPATSIFYATPHGPKRGKVNRFPMTDVYEIALENAGSVRFGKNHLQPVFDDRSTVTAENLRVNDRLPGMWVQGTDGFTGFEMTITGIKKVVVDEPYLYCVELDTPDRLFVLANGLLTHNCRLRLDLRSLEKKGGGLFGAGELTGSVGVCTVNLPQLWYKTQSKESFYAKLDELLAICAKSLELKRKYIEKYTEAGLYPYTKIYLQGIKDAKGSYWHNHFSTIGVIGLNEVCRMAGIGDIGTVDGQDFAKEVLEKIRVKLQDFQEQTGHYYNLEATPAEGTTYRLAQLDKKNCPGILTQEHDGVPFYTNSTQLPPQYTNDVLKAASLQDELQGLYTGGTVFHVFIGEAITDWRGARELVKVLCTKYHMPTFSLTPTYSMCPTHGFISGTHPKCPKCGADCDLYSRTMGYYRAVRQWNAGKQAEFAERVTFELPKL